MDAVPLGMEGAIAMDSLPPSWHAMNGPDDAVVVVRLGFDRDPEFWSFIHLCWNNAGSPADGLLNVNSRAALF